MAALVCIHAVIGRRVIAHGHVMKHRRTGVFPEIERFPVIHSLQLSRLFYQLRRVLLPESDAIIYHLHVVHRHPSHSSVRIVTNSPQDSIPVLICERDMGRITVLPDSHRLRHLRTHIEDDFAVRAIGSEHAVHIGTFRGMFAVERIHWLPDHVRFHRHRAKHAAKGRRCRRKDFLPDFHIASLFSCISSQYLHTERPIITLLFGTPWGRFPRFSRCLSAQSLILLPEMLRAFRPASVMALHSAPRHPLIRNHWRSNSSHSVSMWNQVCLFTAIASIPSSQEHTFVVTARAIGCPIRQPLFPEKLR